MQAFTGPGGTSFYAPVTLEGQQYVPLRNMSRDVEIVVPAEDLVAYVAEIVRDHRLAALEGEGAIGSARFRATEAQKIRGLTPEQLLGVKGAQLVPGPHDHPLPPLAVQVWALATEMYMAAHPFADSLAFSQGGARFSLEVLSEDERAEWLGAGLRTLLRLRATPTHRPLHAFEVVDGSTWCIYLAHDYPDALRHHELHLAGAGMEAESELYVRLLSPENELTVEHESGAVTRTIGSWMALRPTPGFLAGGEVTEAYLDEDEAP